MSGLEACSVAQFTSPPAKDGAEAPSEQVAGTVWFEQTVRPHLSYLLTRARSLTDDGEGAEDLVQETCLRALRFHHQLYPGTNSRAWLRRILQNTFINWVQSQETRKQLVPFEETPARSSTGSSLPSEPHAAVCLRQQEAMVNRVLAQLPPRYSHTLRLYYDGFSYAKIAVELAVPAGTVMSRLHRARRLAAPLVREELREVRRTASTRRPDRLSERTTV